VGEEVAVAVELGPGINAGGDAALDLIRLGEVAGANPEVLDGEADDGLIVPGRRTCRRVAAAEGVRGCRRGPRAPRQASQLGVVSRSGHVVDDHVDASVPTRPVTAAESAITAR
jgi:hypothetical protein